MSRTGQPHFLAAIAAAGLATCAAPGREAVPPPPSVLEISIRENAKTGCLAEVGGRLLTPEELEAWARPLAAQVAEALLRGTLDTPYRCVGHAVFALQRAGFTDIGFIAGPAR